jgi:hypothetical protein
MTKAELITAIDKPIENARDVGGGNIIYFFGIERALGKVRELAEKLEEEDEE